MLCSKRWPAAYRQFPRRDADLPDAMHFKQWYHAAPSFINLHRPGECNKATLFRALEENAAIVSACNLAQISRSRRDVRQPRCLPEADRKGIMEPDSQRCHRPAGAGPGGARSHGAGCAIAAGTGAGLYSDMAGTGEKLVSWHRVFTPNPAHRELYQG